MKILLSLAGACLSVTFFVSAQSPAALPTPLPLTTTDRTVTTFMLFKDKQPTPIGSVQVLIKNLNMKEQKYTVEISIGTRRMEKKDIYAGEPIVFYAANDEQPTEFLVRQVYDDHIEGRLTAPRPLPPALPKP